MWGSVCFKCRDFFCHGDGQCAKKLHRARDRFSLSLLLPACGKGAIPLFCCCSVNLPIFLSPEPPIASTDNCQHGHCLLSRQGFVPFGHFSFTQNLTCTKTCEREEERM